MTWEPYPHQISPWYIPANWAWVLFGGRGTGKTTAAARHVFEHVNGPPCDIRVPGGHRIGIIVPEMGALEECLGRSSGLRLFEPRLHENRRKGGVYAAFPSKVLGGVEQCVEAKLFGASTVDDVERLRASGSRCLWWWENLDRWAQMGPCIQHAQYGLRVGKDPHVVATLTSGDYFGSMAMRASDIPKIVGAFRPSLA